MPETATSKLEHLAGLTQQFLQGTVERASFPGVVTVFQGIPVAPGRTAARRTAVQPAAPPTRDRW
jgi:hypothetical protein